MTQSCKKLAYTDSVQGALKQLFIVWTTELCPPSQQQSGQYSQSKTLVRALATGVSIQNDSVKSSGWEFIKQEPLQGIELASRVKNHRSRIIGKQWQKTSKWRSELLLQLSSRSSQDLEQKSSFLWGSHNAFYTSIHLYIPQNQGLSTSGNVNKTTFFFFFFAK